MGLLVSVAGTNKFRRAGIEPGLMPRSILFVVEGGGLEGAPHAVRHQRPGQGSNGLQRAEG